jgi:hypothetical protein
MLQHRLGLASGWLIAIWACSFLLCGCGGPGGPKREQGTISGKVTLGGEAVKAGRVIFAHVEGPAAAADITSDGTYTTKAAVGKTKASIDYRAPAEEVKGGRPGLMMPGKSLVPEKYADAKTSGLSLEVKPGDNKFDIPMVSK